MNAWGINQLAEPISIQNITGQVQDSNKYSQITPELIHRIIEREMLVTRNEKQIVKRTRSKLHQVASAYQEKKIPYEKLISRLETLPINISTPEVKDFCRDAMRWHSSTRERLPILEDFYSAIFQTIGPVKSILDLACGLNSLAIPWMPQPQFVHYFGCDIFLDQADFLNSYLKHFGITGQIDIVDLSEEIPARVVDVVLLLKTLPCLEQIDKSISRRILDDVKADKIVVSFPATSLGGRKKGMAKNYENHFMEVISGKNWKTDRLVFSSEIVFILHK